MAQNNDTSRIPEQATALFNQIKERMRTPAGNLSILSVAMCEGPEGAYTTRAKGDGTRLNFSQEFSYRDELLELKINGEEGVDAEGNPVSDFMIFYGRMHDYVRIALQPGYLIHEVDSIDTRKDGIIFYGKTKFGYIVEYKTDPAYLPVSFSFYVDEGQPVSTYFDSWSYTEEGIRIPEVVRIADGKKVFTFSYSKIEIVNS